MFYKDLFTIILNPRYLQHVVIVGNVYLLEIKLYKKKKQNVTQNQFFVRFLLQILK